MAVLQECLLTHPKDPTARYQPPAADDDFNKALNDLGANFGFPKGPEKDYKNTRERKFIEWEWRSEFIGA